MLRGKEGEANKGTNNREKKPNRWSNCYPQAPMRTESGVRTKGQHSSPCPSKLVKLPGEPGTRYRAVSAHTNTVPAIGWGRERQFPLAKFHDIWGMGRQGIGCTWPTSHSIWAREDSSSGCFNHSYSSQQSCGARREENCTWLQSGGEQCGSPSIPWCHPTAIPAHLSQALLAGSARVRQPLTVTSRVTTPGRDENTSLASFCGVWGCRELTEIGCAAFSREKRIDINSSWDCSYSSHTGVNVLALGKETNKQGDTHLFLPPINVNPNFSDLVSTEKCYTKRVLDHSESCFQLPGDKYWNWRTK